MDERILTELQQINAQLSQLIRLMQTQQHPTMGHNVGRVPSKNSIAAEVEAQIAEAKRKAAEKVGQVTGGQLFLHSLE